MAYTKINWTDSTTPLDASNMNKIENALSDQDTRIDANTNVINSLRAYYNGTVDAMLSDWATKDNTRPFMVSCYGETAQFLTGISTNGIWSGIGFRNGTNYDFLIFTYSTAAIYYGRATSEGEVTRRYSIASTRDV